MLTKFCVDYLRWRLRKDKGFYIGYQSNIAMCVYDTFKGKRDPNIYDLSNLAATKFMDLWIN